MHYNILPPDGHVSLSEAAKLYADSGLLIFPCEAGGKIPLTKNGFKDATNDPETLDRWWAKWPDANLAYRTGGGPEGSGVFVLDIDGPDGYENLAALEAEHGELPPTATVRSGREDGGEHRIFLCPEGLQIKSKPIAPKLDVKGDGGYCIAPPSLHMSGNRYEWLDTRDPVEAPTWLIEAIRAASKPKSTSGELASIPTGQRNDELMSIAGTMRRRGMVEAGIRAALLEENRTRCNPPLEAEEVEDIARSVIRYNPKAEGFKLTDTGNAERLVAIHGRDLLFCHDWNKWLVWDGTRWVEDRTGEANRRAKKTVRAMYGEAEATEDDQERKKLAKWAARSEGAGQRRAMLDLARTEDGIAISPDDLDADPWLLNVHNGTVDLRTGELRPHERSALNTKMAGTVYDPNAKAPEFEAFLDRIMDGHEPLKRFLQRLVGYMLTGDVSEQKLAFAHGMGANGKTTFINAILDVMGDYGQQAESDLLIMKRRNGNHSTEVADLRGARFVASTEVEEGARLAETLVKQLTGGDKIKARHLYERGFEFDPTHKILLAANHKPEIRGTDHAIWRRIMLIPFEVTIPEAEQDKRLPEKLAAERPGILAWAVRGCLEWQRDGLQPPEAVEAATAEYRRQMDPLAEFFEDHCTFGHDEWTASGALQHHYRNWCMEENRQFIDRNAFFERLRAEGCENKRGSKGVRGWRGIGLQPEFTNLGLVDGGVTGVTAK